MHTTSCPAPTLQPFIFLPYLTAAEHNKTILSIHQYNLGAFIEAHPGSSIAYGSEFHPAEQLEPLLLSHPKWPKLRQTFVHGSQYASRPRDPSHRLQDLEFFGKHGNHKSATTEAGIKLAMQNSDGAATAPNGSRRRMLAML